MVGARLTGLRAGPAVCVVTVAQTHAFTWTLFRVQTELQLYRLEASKVKSLLYLPFMLKKYLAAFSASVSIVLFVLSCSGEVLSS